MMLLYLSYDVKDDQHGRRLKLALKPLQGQIKIVSVLVRPSAWNYSPLQHYPSLPTNGKEIACWSSQDSAWIAVQRGIIAIIERLQIGA